MDRNSDFLRRSRLWREEVARPLAREMVNLSREVALRDAAEAIAKEKRPMANTGAKGFAAILKARAAQMREEFSRLADEVNGEFEAMAGHLANGKATVAEMKKDNAELRDALGFSNDPNPKP